MNDYRLLWKPDAERKLASLWLKVTDRHALSQAANQIDQELTRSPHTKGKAVGMGFRSLVVMPLEVLFTVHPTSNAVVVHEIRYYPSRTNGSVRK
jgi:hypothetical protein